MTEFGVGSGKSGSGNKTRERTRIHHQIGMTANDPIYPFSGKDCDEKSTMLLAPFLRLCS